MKLHKTFTDTEVVNILLSRGPEFDACWKYLHWEYWGMVKGFLMKNGASQEIAKEIYHGALIIFYELIQKGKFRGESSIKTYLFTISKNEWIKTTKKTKSAGRYIQLQQEPEMPGSPVKILLKKEQKQMVQAMLRTLDEKCLKMVRYYYWFELTMDEIARKLGYKDATKCQE